MFGKDNLVEWWNYQGLWFKIEFGLRFGEEILEEFFGYIPSKVIPETNLYLAENLFYGIIVSITESVDVISAGEVKSYLDMDVPDGVYREISIGGTGWFPGLIAQGIDIIADDVNLISIPKAGSAYQSEIKEMQDLGLKFLYAVYDELNAVTLEDLIFPNSSMS